MAWWVKHRRLVMGIDAAKCKKFKSSAVLASLQMLWKKKVKQNYYTPCLQHQHRVIVGLVQSASPLDSGCIFHTEKLSIFFRNINHRIVLYMYLASLRTRRFICPNRPRNDYWFVRRKLNLSFFHAKDIISVPLLLSPMLLSWSYRSPAAMGDLLWEGKWVAFEIRTPKSIIEWDGAN